MEIQEGWDIITLASSYAYDILLVAYSDGFLRENCWQIFGRHVLQHLLQEVLNWRWEELEGHPVYKLYYCLAKNTLDWCRGPTLELHVAGPSLQVPTFQDEDMWLKNVRQEKQRYKEKDRDAEQTKEGNPVNTEFACVYFLFAYIPQSNRGGGKAKDFSTMIQKNKTESKQQKNKNTEQLSLWYLKHHVSIS